jgi:hypothetical protein
MRNAWQLEEEFETQDEGSKLARDKEGGNRTRALLWLVIPANVASALDEDTVLVSISYSGYLVATAMSKVFASDRVRVSMRKRMYRLVFVGGRLC